MSISRELCALRREKKYSELILRVRDAVREDRAGTMANWQVKVWCAERWQNLFLTEAVKDERALKAAKKIKAVLNKNKSDRQWVAERYLRESGRSSWSQEMPSSQFSGLENTTFIFCPGLLNGLLPVRAFQEALPEIEREYGCKIIRADLHPLAGCDSNALNIAKAIEFGIGLNADRELIDGKSAKLPGDVFLLGYSKGMADILTLLVNRPDLAPRIRCVFSWAGAVGGSYIGDDAAKALDKVDENPELLSKVIASLAPFAKLPEIVDRRKDETEIKNALLHLTTQYREDFMLRHEEEINDLGIPIFNLTGSTSPMEVPSFQVQGALKLSKYDANNDMQVTQDQAKVKMPMATDLAMLHGHHWDLSYDCFPKSIRMSSPNLDHSFPKKAALLASFHLAHELGLIS
jgi:hypothetical protein